MTERKPEFDYTPNPFAAPLRELQQEGYRGEALVLEALRRLEPADTAAA